MTEHHDAAPGTTKRERELELEVARLNAELETLRGEDPSLVTSRLLSMAVETMDRAVADAHREADEIVEEVRALAEARRDEATRVAAEAEALAEEKLAEADRANEVIEAAAEQAESIRAAAERDAADLVAAEREKVTVEITALAEVRLAIEDERDTLESYHEELRRRVQELAESMVSFMTTEPPFGTALDGGVTPQLEAVLAQHPEFDPRTTKAEAEAADTVAATAAEDVWVEMLESAISADDRIVDVPEASIEQVPEGPMERFGGVPVVEVEVEEAPTRRAGLFARNRTDEPGFEDLVADDEADDESDESSLFGTFGVRLVEQTSPSHLADALDADDVDDQAFRQFIDGDREPDPSRDWLLRPEQT